MSFLRKFFAIVFLAALSGCSFVLPSEDPMWLSLVIAIVILLSTVGWVVCFALDPSTEESPELQGEVYVPGGIYGLILAFMIGLAIFAGALFYHESTANVWLPIVTNIGVVIMAIKLLRI